MRMAKTPPSPLPKRFAPYTEDMFPLKNSRVEPIMTAPMKKGIKMRKLQTIINKI